jgi:hypothetical protein
MIRTRFLQWSSCLLVGLAAVAAGCGLLVPGLYREWALGPAMKGQDLVTLAMLPVLLAALPATRRGSAGASLVRVGLVGYLLYSYAGAAFAYRFNALFLLYVALFSLSLATLVAALRDIDLGALHARLGRSEARRPVAVFLVLLALLLVASELGQIIPALLAGRVPALLVRSEGAGNFVYVLDLGVVAPLAIGGAVLLWRGSPWGELIAGCIVVKAATMGLALLSMTWFAARAGQPVERGLTAGYVAMTVASLLLWAWWTRGPWQAANASWAAHATRTSEGRRT